MGKGRDGMGKGTDGMGKGRGGIGLGWVIEWVRWGKDHSALLITI